MLSSACSFSIAWPAGTLSQQELIQNFPIKKSCLIQLKDHFLGKRLKESIFLYSSKTNKLFENSEMKNDVPSIVGKDLFSAVSHYV